MSKHYSLCGDQVLEGPKVVCQLGSGGTESDARLIAAAPELLEAAEGCMGYLASLPLAYRPDDVWFKPLTAAIRRARGEE